jgi:hypothetical protein
VVDEVEGESLRRLAECRCDEGGGETGTISWDEEGDKGVGMALTTYHHIWTRFLKGDTIGNMSQPVDSTD